jgi:hypothetical protein
MDAASTSETSLNFYQTTQCNNPEDSHLHTRHHENPISHNFSTSLLEENFVSFMNVEYCN